MCTRRMQCEDMPELVIVANREPPAGGVAVSRPGNHLRVSRRA